MTKVVISNRYQSQTRQNLLKIAGIKNISETITPKNGERIFGQVGAVYFNKLAQNNGNDTGNITPPDCPDCPPIDPPTDPDNPTPDTPQGCTCRSLDELGDYIAQKASESFCESTPVEDDNQYFPCLTGADGGELRISCPNDDNCNSSWAFAIVERHSECSNVPFGNSCKIDKIKFKILFFETQEEFNNRLQIEENLITEKLNTDNACNIMPGNFLFTHGIQCGYGMPEKECDDGYTCSTYSNQYGIRMSLGNQDYNVFDNGRKIDIYKHISNREVENMVLEYYNYWFPDAVVEKL